MDPIREQIELMTRRHFFGRTGLSLGSAALAACWPRHAPRRDADADRRLDLGRHGRRPARPAPFPPEGQAGHLPVT